MVQMHAKSGEAVRAQRTVRAAGFVVGMKHEVIDDELTASREKIRERLTAIGSVEGIILGDTLPGQVALEPAQLVALTGERLLLLEQRASGREASVPRSEQGGSKRTRS